MEIFLTNQELHEFAQWFAFHYGGGIGGDEKQNKYPREEIIELVDTFIKSKHIDNTGFVKWFSEQYEIYGNCKGRAYQEFTKNSVVNKKAKTSQEWIDHHFKGGHVTDGLLYHFFQDKIKGNLFQVHFLKDFKEQMEADGVRIVDEKGNPLDI